MSKIIDSILGYFGYVDKKTIKAPDIPASTDIKNDDDIVSFETFDYWGDKVRKTIHVDDSDNTRYDELDLMDNEVPEINAALDVNADFIVYPNDYDKNQMVKVTSSNPEAQAKIDEIERRVSVQNQLFPMIRSMLKYGNNAEELVVNEERNKFLGFRNIPIKTAFPVMIDGFPNFNPRITQIIAGKVHAELTDEEVFYLCLNSDRARYSQYGKGVSMLETARLWYRQLRLMEEGMMITRLSRSNQNYALVVDVGELQGQDALNFLNEYKKTITRRKYIDPRTGRWSWRYNPLSVIEDIMVPTRAGSGGNVIPLNNHASGGKDIDDLMYCQDKLIYSLKTPKLLLGKEVDVNSKSTSDNQMSTFLRRIRRIQNMIMPEIKSLYHKILKIEGVDTSIDSLDVFWPVNATVDEERKINTEKTKAEIAKILKVDLKVIDDLYIYTKILGLQEEEALELQARVELMKSEEEPGIEPEEEVPVPDKTELLRIVRNKLTDEEYQEWTKMQDIIKANPKLGELIIDFINITQAKLGK